MSKSKLTLLITGARAPVALDLARQFSRAGHTVHVADSLSSHLCRGSRAVAGEHHLPPPNEGLGPFGAALGSIVEENGIDLVLPTCEEIFHVARVAGRLPETCRLFAPDPATLRRLHSKLEFIRWAQDLGLPVPATRELTEKEQMRAAVGRPVVLKPAFSRFGCEVIILPTRESEVRDVEIGPERTWVEQEALVGDQYCTYSVAHEGRLTATSSYRGIYTSGGGPAIHFENASHPAIDEWVERFVAAIGFTGQIAFDFIVDKEGVARPLECNPRSTSGVHLFGDGERLVEAIVAPSPALQRPTPGFKTMLGAVMLMEGFPRALFGGRLGRWWRDFRDARDVIWRREDPKALFRQVGLMIALALIALRNRVGLSAASTLDIEWNGEE